MGGTGVGIEGRFTPFEEFQNALQPVPGASGGRSCAGASPQFRTPSTYQSIFKRSASGITAPAATFSAPDWSLIGPVNTS